MQKKGHLVYVPHLYVPLCCSQASLGAKLFPRETLHIPVGTLLLSHPYKLSQDITKKEELYPELSSGLPPQLIARTAK